MKLFRVLILVLVMTMVGITGCVQSQSETGTQEQIQVEQKLAFADYAYRGLESLRAVHELGGSVCADLYVGGRMSQDDWNKYAGISDKVGAVLRQSYEAMAVYVEIRDGIKIGKLEDQKAVVLQIITELFEHKDELVATYRQVAGDDIKLPAVFDALAFLK